MGLVMVDLYSKVVRLKALKDQSAETVVKAIEKIWITKQGCPRQLRSDRGTNFISQVNAEFCRAWNIKQDVVTAWHPESNGAAENAVKTLKASIMKYCTGKPQTWDENRRDSILC